MSKIVAIGGLGAIGSKVAKSLLKNKIPGLTLKYISVRNVEKAKKSLGKLFDKIKVLPITELGKNADIIIECLPAELFREISYPTINAGATLIVLSSGALLKNNDLIQLAKKTKSKIIVPSGAILGLDAIKASKQSKIHSIKIITKKPPKSLEGAPILKIKKINIKNLSEAIKIYEGNVNEAIKYFPANVNVAATISLAGIGPDKTKIEVWADPNINRNTQIVEVFSDCSNFKVFIESIPDEKNPRTGKMTPLSVLATLNGLSSTISFGT